MAVVECKETARISEISRCRLPSQASSSNPSSPSSFVETSFVALPRPPTNLRVESSQPTMIKVRKSIMITHDQGQDSCIHISHI